MLQFHMINFFNFDILITPYIIGFIYFLGAIVLPFIILYYYKKNNFKIRITTTKYKFYFIIAFLLLEIFWRMFCEFFIVYFKIYLALS